MGGPSASPGGALLRSSRLFSLSKPLSRANISPAELRSATTTKPVPQRQTITSPLSSREKGDWGVKRSLPLKQTMATSTPLLRINEVDSAEKITDYCSAADHSLSLAKFGEMGIALTVPAPKDSGSRGYYSKTAQGMQLKSVFEEDIDFTTRRQEGNDKRWKFQGPWLANMSQGDFNDYIKKAVRPRRRKFRELLKVKLAGNITAQRRAEALENGWSEENAPKRVRAKNITEDELTEFTRSLRADRATLYALVSEFLDLAPLGIPVGIAQAGLFYTDEVKITNSPYGQSGPPPSHPSAGIGYLRTNSYMENHSVYGPQAHRTPTLGRIIQPRSGSQPAKIGVGGFVANVPAGDDEFTARAIYGKRPRSVLKGIEQLDITSFGGAKAYVEPYTATVDTEGKISVEVRSTGAEAQQVAKEGRGQTNIYNDAPLDRTIPKAQEQHASPEALQQRYDQVAEDLLADEEGSSIPEKDIVSSSQSYGLDMPEKK